VFPVNLPNVLTLLRILAVPVLVVALLGKTPNGDLLAAIVFAIASLTDAIDGYLARSRNWVTSFGRLMDPIADKLLIVAALVALVSLHRLAAWVAMVIIAREFAVTGMRMAAAQQGVGLPVSALGKLKTISQVTAVMALIATPAGTWWALALIYLAVAVTILSGVDYAFDLRRKVEESKRRRAAERRPLEPGG
jgi:CDP-diacylglycerol--glycerol-3-phosphate 3-phosphatidyltransferase